MKKILLIVLSFIKNICYAKNTKKYHYIVFYSHSSEIGSGEGMIEVVRKNKIKNYDDAVGIREFISNTKNSPQKANIILTGWELLDE